MEVLNNNKFVNDQVPIKAYQTVDVRTDSTMQILEKLSYEAHNGKSILGLWEAFGPSSINPIPDKSYAREGYRPMEISYKKPSRSTRTINGQPLSVKSSYRCRNDRQQFWGYKSEPPTAPMFHEDTPIGPAATALKATGELVAIAKENNEDEKPIIELFEKVWNAKLDNVIDHITPCLANTSLKDLIKFERKSIHSINGFPGASPSVAVSTTSYRPETITHRLYIDWHLITLTMRFIGEWNSRYNKRIAKAFYKKNMKQLFTPVLSNMPSEVSCNFVPKIDLPVIYKHSETLLKVVRLTLDFYEGSITKYSVMANMRSLGLITSEIPETTFTAEMVKQLLCEDRPKVTRLPVSFSSMKVASGDIYGDMLKPVPLTKHISKLEFEHHLSGRGALKTLLEAVLTQRKSSWSYNELRSLITLNRNPLFEQLNDVKTIRDILLKELPVEFGDMLYKLLRHGTSTDEEANNKFVDVIQKICPGKGSYVLNSRSGLFVQALKQSADLSWFTNVLAGAYRIMSDKYQSSRGIIFRPVPGNHPYEVIIDGLRMFANKKISFWRAHYGSRVKLYHLALNTETKVEVRNVLKRYVILYSALHKCYSILKVHFQKGFNIFLYAKASDWHDWICRSISRFRAKRMNKAEIDMLLELHNVKAFHELPRLACISKEEQDDLSRHKTILELFAAADNMINPPFPFKSLLSEINRRVKVTSASIGITFRKRIITEVAPNDVAYDTVDERDVLQYLAGLHEIPINAVTLENSTFPDEDFEVTTINTVDAVRTNISNRIATSNMYDIFIDGSSEDSDEESKAEDPNIKKNKDNTQNQLKFEDRFGDDGDGKSEDAEDEPNEDDDFDDMFGGDIEDVKEDESCSGIVDLVSLINSEFNASFTAKEISDHMGITNYEVTHYNLNFEFGKLADIYNELVRKKMNVENISLELGGDMLRDVE